MCLFSRRGRSICCRQYCKLTMIRSVCEQKRTLFGWIEDTMNVTHRANYLNHQGGWLICCSPGLSWRPVQQRDFRKTELQLINKNEMQFGRFSKGFFFVSDPKLTEHTILSVFFSIEESERVI